MYSTDLDDSLLPWIPFILLAPSPLSRKNQRMDADRAFALKWVVAPIVVLAFLAAVVLLPLCPCPMCGNPDTTALRRCYCDSNGRVNLVAFVRWPSQRSKILEAMGLCEICRKRQAVAKVATIEAGGKKSMTRGCRECFVSLGMDAESLDAIQK